MNSTRTFINRTARLILTALVLTALALPFSVQPARAATTTVSDQASCEATGAVWSGLFCLFTSPYTVNAGDTLRINVEVEFLFGITNNGTVIADARVTASGTATNNGTITIHDPFRFRDSLHNTSTGIINVNLSILDISDLNNDGIVTIHSGATLRNSGTVDNQNLIEVKCGGRLDGRDTYTGNPVVQPSDCTPPVITPNVVGTLGTNGWYVSDVMVSWSVTDPESAIGSQTGCDPTTINMDTAGIMLTCIATSTGGSNSQSVTIKRDATTPSVACGSIDGLWHASDVHIACSASDATSKLANAADANFNLTTSVASGTEDAIASTDARAVADQAGNLAIVRPISSNMVDKKAPSITVTSPTATSYSLNQAVAAHYLCSDGGSGVASCTGTVANGANIETTSAGVKTFTVNATDNVGNTNSASVTYNVTYNFSGFFQPVDNLPVLNVVNAGSGVPVKFSLGGDMGLNILAVGYPKIQQIACDGGAPSDVIEETVTSGNSGLQYDSFTHVYTYVWKTQKSWAGTCRQLIVRLADGTDHIASFKFK